MEEKIIETKICKYCSANFNITDLDIEFYNKVSPVFKGVKYNIPSPTFCPDCRQQRRLSFRNERNLYKRKSNLSGKDIISIYSPDKPFKIFEQSEWWSDNWNPMDYSKNFDFSRSFFEQFEELMEKVPVPNVSTVNNENSPYTNYVSNLKECHLISSSDYNENCMYGNWIENSKNCLDSSSIDRCEESYEVFFSQKIFKSLFIVNSENCSNSKFLYDCKNCHNCFMCHSLRNKNYFINNKEYTKEEYENIVNNIILSHEKVESLKKDFSEMLKKYPKLFINKNGIIEDSTCDYLIDCKNCHDCYLLIYGKDCKYVDDAFEIKTSYDSNYASGELGYENCETFPMPYKGIFNFNTYTGNDLIYTMFCMSNCKNLFGCIGLRNSQYCILNKQYTKEEYETLVPKIIEHMKSTGEWGEFFPSAISPFGYNETVASEYFQLSQIQAKQKGFKWSDYENPKPEVSKIIPASKLPDEIKDIPDDILNWAILCEISEKPFRIIKPELDFYRKYSIPVPRKHPDQRHLDRMKLRNPRKLYDRNCDKCNKEIKTTYNPDRSEIVYCEECYNKEIY